jgi:hypothetical protein
MDRQWFAVALPASRSRSDRSDRHPVRVQRVFSLADLKTHFVATDAIWDPADESKEKSGSSDRSSGRAKPQDRGVHHQP